jgi:flavin reductase (DIM6/NTAB) family NADH-FMN oxidoreductase RutF
MMNKNPIKLFELWPETIASLTREGLLLCSVGTDGQPDVMTIGWMTGGAIWGKPIITVLVRPSRHTFSRLNEIAEFTVNVLPPDRASDCEYCGTKSGRDTNKFADTGLEPVPAQTVRVPVIAQALICYECRVVATNEILPATLAPAVKDSAYRNGDYHRVYFGEATAAYAVADARERLRRPLL